MTVRSPISRLGALALALALSAAPALAQQLPTEGRSLGGNWREAPSTDGARLGRLDAGQPVRILANTGRTFDGYNWFAIEVDGETGFQWGGVLCSNGVAVEGLAEVCAGTEGTLAPAAAPAAPVPAPAPATPADEAGPTLQAATPPADDGLAFGDPEEAAVLDGVWTPLTPTGGSCEAGVLGRLEIAEGRLVAAGNTCEIGDAVPFAAGLRLIGTCTVAGRTEILDTIAFIGPSRKLLAMVDQTAGDMGTLVVYRACPPAE